MSDKKSSVCADCGAVDASWGVINRGVIICDECCIIHRTMGRHYSQVKSLLKSVWRQSQLNMVYMLNNNGINSFWEHSLHDPKSNRKKPLPTDPLHPVKAEFIRTKYQDLGFTLKTKSNDNQEDLNQQLHSSVRTSNLETSLRLLIHGADCNYYHPEKGNFVIHVAAHAGQMEQFELLASYGACLNMLDKNGNSAAKVAKLNGHSEISDKITECMYEITDKLCYFLCTRFPDHKNGQHFFIPEISECTSVPIFNKQARVKLQQLNNILFEDLVMDVYDEIDRRENEAIYCSTCSDNEQGLVPFLPVNPKLSATRNQGRQKLARLSKEEFASLVWDILMDAHRRESSFSSQDPLTKLKLEAQDDEPLYDSVASDEDYAYVDQSQDEEITDFKINQNIPEGSVSEEKSEKSCRTSEDGDSQINVLQSQIAELVNQISDLQRKVELLNTENVDLRNKVSQQTVKEDMVSLGENSDGSLLESKQQRPTSLYNIAQQFIGTSCNLNRLTPPHTDEVLCRTDQVTKSLQELSAIMWSTEAKNHAYIPCAEQIRMAVCDLSSIFPTGTTDEVIRNALRTLNINTIRLQATCSEMDVTIEKLRTYAFNLAKANRQILTQFQ